MVIEVREARVLVHHAVYELSELQQESFAGGEAICPQGLDEMHHMWNNLEQCGIKRKENVKVIYGAEGTANINHTHLQLEGSCT